MTQAKAWIELIAQGVGLLWLVTIVPLSVWWFYRQTKKWDRERAEADERHQRRMDAIDADIRKARAN